MDSVNKVILVGNLGQAPKTSIMPSGRTVCRFPLATIDKFGGIERTEWHNIVLIDQAAEKADKYLRKGHQVYIEGRIQARKYQDKETGEYRYRTEIIGYILKQLDSPQSKLKTYTNSIGMEFVLIPAGTFRRDTETEENLLSNGLTVTISKPFYLGIYPVTQEQWEAVMESNPSEFEGRNNPVEGVYWDDAQEFIKRLNAREKHQRYRLPTEMEWELAARAGTATNYFFGNDEERLSEYAWFVSVNSFLDIGLHFKRPFAEAWFERPGLGLEFCIHAFRSSI